MIIGEFSEEVCGRQVECSAQGTLVGVNGALILSLSEGRPIDQDDEQKKMSDRRD